MNSSVGPTEDVFQELLKHFVAPLLRNEASGNHLPSISLQNSVAKQMHAVVLLYNYFHRKHHPALELLGFESCCKLAVIMEPSLIMHMKLMQRSDYTKEDDRDSQLSLTENAIMDACDVSSALDANKDVPNMGGWPVSKVTVLLVDSKKENCLLLFSSITRGIWSVVEKDVDASNINSGSSINQKPKSYRRKASNMLHRDELNTYDGDLQKLAISAVEEISGINQTDIMVLESHIAYSLSKEKTVARFFILQTSQLISEDLQVPVKDLIESLQGPLVQKKSYDWRLTPVVNYFHVLPYATILSDWISRELSSKSLGEKIKIDCIYTESSYKAEDQQLAEVNEDRSISNKDLSAIDAVGNGSFTGNGESPKQNTINGYLAACLYNTGRPFKLDVDNSSLISIHSGDKSKETLNAVTVDNHIHIANSMDCCKNTSTRGISNGNLNCSSENPKDKNKGLREMTYFSNSRNEPRKIDVDKTSLICTHTENKIKNSSNAVEINNPKNEKTASMDIDKDGAISCADLTAEMIDSPVEFLITETTPAELNIQNRNCRTSSSGGDLMALEDRSFSPHQLNPKSKPMLIQASKKDALSQTALKVLLKKRETLSLKLRALEDELAMCDKHIQKILNGGEDDLALKIQILVDSCNDVFMNGNSESHNIACQVGEEQSDAIVTLKTPCQELDAICCVNNWILPTYSLSSPNDGFLATINVKGRDFELSEQSDLSSSPHEARESAAAKMVASLKLKVSHRIVADAQV